MMLFPRLLLLCSLLLWAQSALAAHGIEHAFHEHDQACIECLALPGMQAVPKPMVRLPVLRQLTMAGMSAVPPAPTVALHPAFHSRAPPELHD